MADITSVIMKIQDALTEAQTVAGVPTDAQQIADLQAQVTALTADKAALQAKIDAAKQKLADANAADATEDAARNEALTALG